MIVMFLCVMLKNMDHFVGGALSGHWFHRIWHHEAFAEDTSKREEEVWACPCLKFWSLYSAASRTSSASEAWKLPYEACNRMKQPRPQLCYLVLIVSRNSYSYLPDIFFHSNSPHSFTFWISSVHFIHRVEWWNWVNILWVVTWLYGNLKLIDLSIPWLTYPLQYLKVGGFLEPGLGLQAANQTK